MNYKQKARKKLQWHIHQIAGSELGEAALSLILTPWPGIQALISTNVLRWWQPEPFGLKLHLKSQRKLIDGDNDRLSDLLLYSLLMLTAY